MNINITNLCLFLNEFNLILDFNKINSKSKWLLTPHLDIFHQNMYIHKSRVALWPSICIFIILELSILYKMNRILPVKAHKLGKHDIFLIWFYYIQYTVLDYLTLTWNLFINHKLYLVFYISGGVYISSHWFRIWSWQQFCDGKVCSVLESLSISTLRNWNNC